MHPRSLVAVVAVLLLSLGILQPSTAVDSPAGQLASEVAASGTPHVLDGEVYAVTRVGNTVVLGGDFSRARNDNSNTALNRNRLLAFDATTGQISTSFVPNPNGTVRTVIPAGDGQTVYVGGNFTSIGGVARSRLARIRVSDGSVVSTFNAGTISGQVRDLALSNGRLWLAGAFTHVSGKAQPALATVDPATGQDTPFMERRIAGVHRGTVTQVLKIAITPDGSRLVAVGNFRTLDDVVNHQLLVLDLTGPSAAPSSFRTSFFTAPCSASFDTYMRDVDLSPDGSWFVVTTTGAYGGSSGPCDTHSRFETAAAGANVQPSWVNYTGGDTTYGVEITDSAVYVGGHFRWTNNPFAGDRAGPGAVARPGLAALDPLNGLPLTWNPTRTLGVGVFDFLPTEEGLWIASDTDRIGNFQYKGRIARMPFTGATFPAVRTPDVPNDLYQAGAGLLQNSDPVRRSFTGTTAGAPVGVPDGGLDWGTIRGSFMLNGWLYLAHSNGSFTKRTFNGSTYGPPVAVNTHDQLSTLTAWRSDIQAATGMFFDSGRIYFTRSDSTQLFYRYFSPQSDVVGAHRLVAANSSTGISFNSVRGMFGTGDELYWTTALDGRLRRATWAHGAQAGGPVPGTATILSGAGTGWSSRVLWLHQDATGGGVGLPPTAAFSHSCTSLTCAFDGSASTADGGQVTGWSWDFGDGTTGTGETVQHAFPTSGRYPVTLTVTTAAGQTDTETRAVDVVRVNQPPTASFTSTCTGLTCALDASASSDPEGPLTAYGWDFGDGTTGSGVSPEHTYPSPGPRTVTLTVTDSDGTTASSSQTVEPVAQQVAFVAANAANANTSTQRVVVPPDVQAGDALVLYLTLNTTAVTISPPAGWTQLEAVEGSGIQGRAWWRTATAADAGSTVSVPLSGLAKGDLTVSAYRGTGGAATVTAHGSKVDETLAAEHTTPTVTATDPTSWVSSYWAGKTSSDLTWTTPATQLLRASTSGSGSGRIVAVAADSGAAVPPGSGSSTASATPEVARVVMFATVIELE